MQLFEKRDTFNKCMSSLKRKSKHRHLIEHIQISVCTKLHILSRSFWGFLSNLVFFWSKKGKMNIIIKFSIFELV